MSEFEKWAINYGLDYEPSFNWRSAVEAAWQAATAGANKRILELEGEVAKAKEYASMCNSETINIGQFYDHALLENKQLQAHINVLREALEEINNQNISLEKHGVAMTYINKQSIKTLEITPAQSLIQHDNEVIERVVTLLKDWTWGDGIIDMRVDDLIEDVRKLKGK